MELFERVKKLATEVAGSQTSLAKKLGLSQQTFSGYLKAERQNNLWPLLPQMLVQFPEISRDWLYFGEGEMLGDLGAHPDKEARLAEQQELENLREENHRLKAELAEADRVNRKLTARMLIDGVGDKDASNNTAKAAGQK